MNEADEPKKNVIEETIKNAKELYKATGNKKLAMLMVEIVFNDIEIRNIFEDKKDKNK